MDHVIGFATRGISLGIATASEAIAGHKKSKNAQSSQAPESNSTSQENESSSDEDPVETAWQLDEAGQGEAPPVYELEETVTTLTSAGEVAVSFINHHRNAIDISFEHKPLPQPVILPQRRPMQRSRGFVRAYPPSLGECSNIDQKTFIDFLNDFDKASKASPIFDVINIACFGVGLVPSTICIAVSTAVGTASKAAQELQSRYRTNKYLDNINESLFKPRGLYAMIMTYKPDMADEAFLRADTTDPTSLSLVKTLTRLNDNKLKQRLSRFRTSSGTINHDLQIPHPAPLIYPALDRLSLTNATNPPSLSLSNSKTPTTKSHINTYLDSRAQTTFHISHPTSPLSHILPPPPQNYATRFSDPNHRVNSGSIFGLLSGGTFDPIALGRVRRAESAAKRQKQPPLTEEERHDAYMGRKVRGRVSGTPSKTISLPLLGEVGKVLRQGVLYLIVVNLPSEEEIARVRRELEGL